MADRRIREKEGLDDNMWWCEHCGKESKDIYAIDITYLDELDDVSIEEHYLCVDCYGEFRRRTKNVLDWKG